jgi:hypothetical protein
MRRWSDLPTAVRIAVFPLLMGAALLFRAFFSQNVMPPPERMQGEATQAYRYALMVSRGEGIPRIDPLVMHPEGFPTGQNSLFEEYLAGWLHRAAGGDFDVFIRRFCLVFPLLAMPGLFLWSRAAGLSARSALAASALYGIMLPALLRARGESLYRETVAIPMLVFLGWTLERALGAGKNRVAWSASAGVLLFLALASWKVAGFLSAFLFLYLLFRRDPAGPAVLLPLGAAQLAASLVLSHMRHDGALLSPGSMLAAAAMISCIPAGGFRGAARWIGAGAAVLSALLLPGSGGHVAAVALAKARFLFRHPGDPALLTPDARLFWVGGYTSPTPGEFLWMFGVPGVLAVSAAGRFLSAARGTLLAGFIPLALAGCLFFDRLHVFLAVALAPAAVMAFRRNALLPVVFLLAGAQTMLAPRLAQALDSAGLGFRPGASLLTDGELDDYLDWAASTEPGDGFAAYWHLSGLTSAYAGRPTVLHTFFENQDNRRRIQEFASALYGSEENLAAFMEENRAEYLVYQADFMLDLSWQGAAYLGGVVSPPETCAAFLMQYRPESLQRLAPVWQGWSLRVFRLDGRAADLPQNPLFRERYRSFMDYDAALAATAEPVGTGLSLASRGMAAGDPDRASAGLLLMSGDPVAVPPEAAVGPLQFLVQAHLDGTYGIRELEEDFLAYLDGWGPDPAIRLDLVRLLERAGLGEEAARQYGIAVSEGGAR